MNNPIQHAIEARRSIDRFRPDVPLGDSVIATLVAQATRAPSAYNLQNWRFVAVRSAAAKLRLSAVAYGQRKVVEASVAFIVCGTLRAHRRLAAALQPSVEAGVMTARTADTWDAGARRARTRPAPAAR